MASVLRKDLRLSVGDGVSFSVMVGLGETYVPAFALALGLSEVAAGWIVSLPILAGALLQVVSPRAVRLLRSHRRWVVLCASVQALTVAAYAVGAVVGSMPALALFAIAAAYWGSGFATGPAWNTWIGTVVPPRIRPHFFALRGRLCQVGVFAGFVGGGLALQLGASRGVLMWTFGAMFLIAALARALSAVLLALVREPRLVEVAPFRIQPITSLRRLRHDDGGRLLLYLVAVQAAVQFAGPFFTPYMLKQLRFSYMEFLLVLAVSFGTKTIVLPVLGRFARRAGSAVLLRFAAIGIVPLSALWMVSDSLAWLLAVQLVAGAVWAAYELSSFLLLFEHIDESRRTGVLTVYNVAHALATVGGALAGGLLLHRLNVTAEAYLLVFGVSSVLRLLALGLLVRLRQLTFAPAPLPLRTIAVRPNAGSLDAPILSGIAAADEEGDAASV